MNEFKKQEAPEVEEQPAPQPAQAAAEGKGAVGKIISSMNIMGYVSKDMMVSVMPYIFFLMVFALLYIGNSYHADKMVRAIDKTGKDIKELRSEYIASKTELMQKSKQSAVAAEVSKYNLKESIVPPRKIVVQQIANSK
ncbi:MAG: FtsL-like putative cell division protein [Bacteroidia bacterium]